MVGLRSVQKPEFPSTDRVGDCRVNPCSRDRSLCRSVTDLIGPPFGVADASRLTSPRHLAFMCPAVQSFPSQRLARIMPPITQAAVRYVIIFFRLLVIASLFVSSAAAWEHGAPGSPVDRVEAAAPLESRLVSDGVSAVDPSDAPGARKSRVSPEERVVLQSDFGLELDTLETTRFLPDGHGLLEVFRLAEMNDDTWAEAQSQYRAVREIYPIARSELLPSVSLSGSAGQTRRDTAFDTGSQQRTYSQDAVRFQVRQPLLALDARFRSQMAMRDVDIGALELELARQDLISRVLEAYVNLLLAQETLELSAAESRALAAQVEQAERMRAGGVATVTDVQDAQARRDLARAREIGARNLLEVRRRELRAITHTDISRVFTLSEGASLVPPVPTDPQVWIDKAGEHAHQVLAGLLALGREQLNLRRSRAQRYPTIDILASYERYSNSDLGFSEDEYARIFVEFNLPLYSGGRVGAQTRESRARMNQASDSLRRIRHQSELQASTSYIEVVNSLARIEALKQALRSSEAAFHSAEVSLTVAYRTFVDVLNAQHQVFEARFQLLRARADYVMALVALHASVGMLDESIVEEIDAWLTRL